MAAPNKQGLVLDAYGRGWQKPEEKPTGSLPSNTNSGPWSEATQYTGGVTGGTHHWSGSGGPAYYTPGGPGDNRLTNTGPAYSLLTGGLYYPIKALMQYAGVMKPDPPKYAKGTKTPIKQTKFKDLSTKAKFGRLGSNLLSYLVPIGALYEMGTELHERTGDEAVTFRK